MVEWIVEIAGLGLLLQIEDSPCHSLLSWGHHLGLIAEEVFGGIA